MSTHDDGGPAFPVVIPGIPGTDVFGTEVDCHYIGMTLLDYFAASAMQGWIASYAGEYAHPGSSAEQSRRVSMFSYEIAEAMLEARIKRQWE